MRFCKDGRIHGQTNKEAGNHLGILWHKKKVLKGRSPNQGFQKGHVPLTLGMHFPNRKKGKSHLHSEATKEKMRRPHPQSRGKGNPHYGKPAAHGKGAYCKGIWMRSTWEIEIAKWLDKQGWKWLYEPKRFELKDRTYSPDFYLPEQNVYWEVKGWFHERHQETIRQFRELFPNERIVVITKKVYPIILAV